MRLSTAVLTLVVLLGVASWLIAPGPHEAPQAASTELTRPVLPPPKSKGKGPIRCVIDCPPCTQSVDLTPRNPVDCNFACEPIPHCTIP